VRRDLPYLSGIKILYQGTGGSTVKIYHGDLHGIFVTCGQGLLSLFLFYSISLRSSTCMALYVGRKMPWYWCWLNAWLSLLVLVIVIIIFFIIITITRLLPDNARVHDTQEGLRILRERSKARGVGRWASTPTLKRACQTKPSVQQKLEVTLMPYADVNHRINHFGVAVEGKSLHWCHKSYTITLMEIICPDWLCREVAAPDIPFTCYAPAKYRTFLKLIAHNTSHMTMKECQELQLLCTVS
jgi:uncharacterized membrane protein